MTGFDDHRRCLLPVGKFHHDDHEVLRARDDFLCSMVLRQYVIVMIPLTSGDLVVSASSAQVVRNSYSALMDVWIVG
jgi:hypothetical protein